MAAEYYRYLGRQQYSMTPSTYVRRTHHAAVFRSLKLIPTAIYLTIAFIHLSSWI
ncbi:hypothetical protein BDW69DRAFT_161703, partial [Aspergillus filifer]